jgi:hypothetical protein
MQVSAPLFLNSQPWPTNDVHQYCTYIMPRFNYKDKDKWVLNGSDDGCWIIKIGFCTLSIVRIFLLKLNTRRFRDSIRLRPQVRGKTPILLGPLERDNLNHWTTPVTRAEAIMSKVTNCNFICNIPLLKTLLLGEENRRLKRNWPIDLIWGTGDSPLDDSPSRHFKITTLAYRL